MSMRIHQKCPREFTLFVPESSPFMSMRILPPCLKVVPCGYVLDLGGRDFLDPLQIRIRQLNQHANFRIDSRVKRIL